MTTSDHTPPRRGWRVWDVRLTTPGDYDTARLESPIFGNRPWAKPKKPETNPLPPVHCTCVARRVHTTPLSGDCECGWYFVADFKILVDWFKEPAELDHAEKRRLATDNPNYRADCITASVFTPVTALAPVRHPFTPLREAIEFCTLEMRIDEMWLLPWCANAGQALADQYQVPVEVFGERDR